MTEIIPADGYILEIMTKSTVITFDLKCSLDKMEVVDHNAIIFSHLVLYVLVPQLPVRPLLSDSPCCYRCCCPCCLLVGLYRIV